MIDKMPLIGNQFCIKEIHPDGLTDLIGQWKSEYRPIHYVVPHGFVVYIPHCSEICRERKIDSNEFFPTCLDLFLISYPSYTSAAANLTNSMSPVSISFLFFLETCAIAKLNPIHREFIQAINQGECEILSLPMRLKYLIDRFVLKLVRRSKGLKPLCLSEKLNSAALLHSRWMGKNKKLTHGAAGDLKVCKVALFITVIVKQSIRM